MCRKPSSRKKGQSAPHTHPRIVREDPPGVREDPLTIHGAYGNCPAPHIASSSVPPQVQFVHSIAREATNANVPILPHQGSTPTLCPQQADSSQISESRGQCRILIEPNGEEFSGFRTSSVISGIIKRHFEGPWTSFSEVPIMYKNIWFEEFEKRFRWLPEHDSQVRINWNKMCSKRLRSKLAYERTKKTAPGWIQTDHWAKMQEYFNSPKVKETSEIEKRNREKLDGPSHTGGSISFLEHEERARSAKGDSFDYLQLHDDLHTIKSGPKKGEFVSEKSQKLSEKVHSLKAVRSAESSQNSVTQQKEDKYSLLEANAKEGIKKGRIYGLGSAAVDLIRPPMSSSARSSSANAVELQNEVDELKMTVRKMESKQCGMKRKQHTFMMNVCSLIGMPVPPMDDTDDSDDDDVSFDPVDHHPSVAGGSNQPSPPPPSAAAPAHCFG